MMKRYAVLAALLLFMVLFAGCKESDTDNPTPSNPSEEPLYGYYTLGEEEIPVVSCSMAREGQFLLKLSPLNGIYSATTYVVVGVHTDWLGKEMDVEYRYHNDDYLFIYEDPLRYYSNYRPLKSGSLFLDCNEAGCVTVRVDVVLYDGTPFRYENDRLFPPLGQDGAFL